MEITDIQVLTKEYAESNDKLQNYLNEFNEALEDVRRKFNEALEDVRRKYIGMIKISSVELSRKTEILANAISENKHLFVKPKTFTFHGIKVGLNKSKESFEIEDEERTMKLIEKFFDEEKNFYIDLKKSMKKRIFILI